MLRLAFYGHNEKRGANKERKTMKIEA